MSRPGTGWTEADVKRYQRRNRTASTDEAVAQAQDPVRVETTAPLHITIDELAPGLNGSKGLMRMHWNTYRGLRDRWTFLIRNQVNDYVGRWWEDPLFRKTSQVYILRHYARQPMDIDNLYSTAKIPLDALCHAGVLADDDPECVGALTVNQCKVDTVDAECTHITIFP